MALMTISTPVTAEMITTDWRYTGYWINELNPDIMDSFYQDFRRHPTVGRYFVCQNVEKCRLACEFLKNDPFHPGLLAVDCEFVSKSEPWYKWSNPGDHDLDISKNGDTASCGPFAAVIQVARVDGYVVVFDLYRIGIVPPSLIDLLVTAKGIVMFASKSDICALRRSDKRFSPLGTVVDVQELWSALQDGPTIEFLRERLAPHLPCNTSARNVFRMSCPTHQPGLSLPVVAKNVLGPNVKKDLRGQGMQWASNDLTYEHYHYAARDSLITLDLFLVLDEQHDQFVRANSLISKERNCKRFPVFDFATRPCRVYPVAPIELNPLISSSLESLSSDKSSASKSSKSTVKSLSKECHLTRTVEAVVSSSAAPTTSKKKARKLKPIPVIDSFQDLFSEPHIVSSVKAKTKKIPSIEKKLKSESANLPPTCTAAVQSSDELPSLPTSEPVLHQPPVSVLQVSTDAAPTVSTVLAHPAPAPVKVLTRAALIPSLMDMDVAQPTTVQVSFAQLRRMHPSNEIAIRLAEQRYRVEEEARRQCDQVLVQFAQQFPPPYTGPMSMDMKEFLAIREVSLRHRLSSQLVVESLDALLAAMKYDSFDFHQRRRCDLAGIL